VNEIVGMVAEPPNLRIIATRYWRFITNTRGYESCLCDAYRGIQDFRLALEDENNYH
jgi:hypothetical protein